MVDYELTILFPPHLKQAEKDKLLAALRAWIKKGGKGKIRSEEAWGMRPLAYPIKKQTEAFYYFMEVQADGDLNGFLQEQVALESKILRYLLVKKPAAKVGVNQQKRVE